MDAASSASIGLDTLLHQDDVSDTGGIVLRIALATKNVRLDLAALAVGAVYLSSFFPLSVAFSASQNTTIQ
jgi:hypothetical protein